MGDLEPQAGLDPTRLRISDEDRHQVAELLRTVPKEMSIFAMMGGADLDLREATFAAQEVVIIVNCFMGGAQITVGPHTNVVMEGSGIMGGYSGPGALAPSETDPSAPTVRVRGVAVWGGVSVDRKPLP